MQIADKCVVAIDYTLTDDDNNQLDSSAGREPLHYLHGAKNIIPGLEAALTGKSVGDELRVDLEPEQAYGPVDPELIQAAPHTAFDDMSQVKPGVQFQAQGPDGQVRIVTVKEVRDNDVVIDANHPLAGKALHFDVTVKDIREATRQALDHGHVHGPGGVHE